MTSQNLKNSISREEALGRLTRAVISMGLTYLDCIEILEYEEDCESAYWSFDPKTKKEKIVLGLDFVSLPPAQIQMALRHEVLHRTTYNGFAQRFHNAQLANIVFDICINRMLYISFPDEMKELARRVYSIDTNSNILCLANPNARLELIPEEFKNLWIFIWEKNEFGNYNYFTSTSLYYKLEMSYENIKEYIPDKDSSGGRILSCRGGCGGVDHKNDKSKIRNDESPSGEDYNTNRSNNEIFNKLGNCAFEGLNPGFSEDIFEHSVVPIEIGVNEVKKFLNRIMAAKIASKVLNELQSEDRYTDKFRPYPLYPTRKGMIYLLSGISRVMSLYHNRITDINYSKLALGIYIDMSGSMEDYFPILPIFVKHLKTYPLKIKGFTNFLYDLQIDDIMKGTIKGGGGTDFNPIFEDLLTDKELHAGLIITDGNADVTNENINKFRASEKKLYQILFSDISKDPLSSLVDAEYLFKYIK